MADKLFVHNACGSRAYLVRTVPYPGIDFTASEAYTCSGCGLIVVRFFMGDDPVEKWWMIRLPKLDLLGRIGWEWKKIPCSDITTLTA